MATTWRKGLRWDKTKQGWVNAKTGRKLSPTTLARRKAKAAPSKPRKKAAEPKRPKGWRKGLRWNKKKGGWVEKATGRLLTERAIAHRGEYIRRSKEIRQAPKEKQAIYELFKDELKAASQDLQDRGYRADFRVHRNKDGSIDAELRIKPKRGQKVNDVYLDMEEVLAPIPNTFISAGIRYHPRKDEEYYTKFQGMSQAQAYYQEMSPEKLHVNLLTGRVIDEKMRGRGRRKAEQVFVRLHWNAEHQRPETPLQRERQKGRKK